MATFDIETAACSFTETLAEKLESSSGLGSSFVEVGYPTWDKPRTVRLWLDEDSYQWVEVTVSKTKVTGKLCTQGRRKISITEGIRCYKQVRQIQKLWKQFLKA